MTNTAHTVTRTHTTRGAAALVAVAAIIAACGGSSSSTDPSDAQPGDTEPATTVVDTTAPATTLIRVPEPDETPAEPLVTDVDFGADPAAGRSTPPLLDVWAADGLENAPVLVVFHGIPTDREVTAELSAEFAERGYLVYNADWQFDPEAPSFTTGGNLHGACAVRFARESAEQYGGDPDDVAALGYSAGGAISAVLALNGDAISGQCAVDDSVSAVPDRMIAFAGMFEYQLLESAGVTFGPMLRGQDPDLWADVNPYEQLDRAGEVPALLVHGDSDDVIPLASTERFSEALTDAGGDVTTHVLRGVDHFVAFDEALASAADLVDAWYSR